MSRLAKALKAQAEAAGARDVPMPRFQVADAEESDGISGFPHNAVTPLGMATQLPVVVSRAIAELPAAGCSYVWLGGGEVHVKLRLPVPQLLRGGVLAPAGHCPAVIGCTDLREEGDEDTGPDGAA